MVEMDKVDVSLDFEISFIECDCPLIFPGYYVKPVQRHNDVIRLSRE
jgi:hypothetical protein